MAVQAAADPKDDDTKIVVRCSGPGCGKPVLVEDVFCSEECAQKAHGF